MSSVMCGTRNGYRKHRRAGEEACRACKSANSEYATSIRSGLVPTDDPRHGTVNCYLNLGCRCPDCCAVAVDHRARLKAERVARSLASWPARLDLANEEWKPVVGGEGLYEVSSFGRVYSIRQPGRAKSGRFLATHPRKSGHLSLGLSIGGERRQVDVHVLVMRAFVGPPPEGLEIRHLDGDPSNNHVDNLRYGTRRENVQDSIRHGTHWPTCLRRTGNAA